jgi:AbrB family looped-hinge helix DNA binding protein
MKARVSEKGQVTIPKRLRDRLGIRPGQLLDFDVERGTLIAKKVEEQDPLDRWYGVLRLGRTTDELMEELRGTPDAVD